MESVITLRCNRISAIAFDLTGTNTVIAVLLAPALYIPQDNFWRGEKDVACTTANTVLHYIYSNGKNITIFTPCGINGIEYLFLGEKILWTCL